MLPQPPPPRGTHPHKHKHVSQFLPLAPALLGLQTHLVPSHSHCNNPTTIPTYSHPSKPRVTQTQPAASTRNCSVSAFCISPHFGICLYCAKPPLRSQITHYGCTTVTADTTLHTHTHPGHRATHTTPHIPRSRWKGTRERGKGRSKVNDVQVCVVVCFGTQHVRE